MTRPTVLVPLARRHYGFAVHGERATGARLAAIHSLLAMRRCATPSTPAHRRVLAIPAKRGDKTIVTFLTGDEAVALAAARDRDTRTGRLDHTWMLLAIQTACGPPS